MSKLKKEELLEWLGKCWSLYKTSQDEWELSQQAYQQIEEMIQKPEVTEEWIEMKAKELRDLMIHVLKSYQEMSHKEGGDKLKDFIRSLVEEIK